MSQESLSALLDGECSGEEFDRLLEEMERRPELREAFSELCLARELREGTRVARGQACICAGVMARLDEPTAESRPKVREIRPRAARLVPLWHQLKPYAGMALAASLGAVAVLVTMPQPGGDSSGGGSMSPSVSSPVSLPLPATRRPRNLQTVSVDPQDDLDTYLIEHSNALADRGMGGTLSYASFSAQSAEERPAAPARAETEDQR